MADYRLQIVTPERVVFDDEVTSIVAPGAAGYLGVLAHHAPLLTTLRPGTLTIRRGEDVNEYHVESGFLEVSENTATLLVDAFEDLAAEERASSP